MKLRQMPVYPVVQTFKNGLHPMAIAKYSDNVPCEIIFCQTFD
jgi:hypothetical protein